MQKIEHQKFKWSICADFKVIAILLGLQAGYTKFCCFLCEWDSRSRDQHYIKRDWPVRQALVPGSKNVKHEQLVDSEKNLLPPLHIKLGLMKNFVKAMDKNGEGFQYIKNKFPRISEAKIKEGIFVGPDIRQLMNDKNFESTLSVEELTAWKSFTLVVTNFLGNIKAENYRELVDNMLEAYKKLGCNMSLKIHLMHSHLDFFPQNLGAVSDEHGERFHQEIACMEKRYQGKWTPSMLADFCWTLCRDAPDVQHKRRATSRKF